MPMIEDQDKYLQWRYDVTEFIILYTGRNYELPVERIASISILNDYENNLFPVFRIELILEPSVYYEIMKEKNTVRFKIRIQKYYRERGKQEKSLYRDYINTTFSLIMDDDENDYESMLKRNSDIPDDKGRLEKLDNRMEFFLYKEDIVYALKSNINAIISSASMSGAIGYTISQAKLNGKILMSPLENSEIYKEVILPPQNALKTIQYLDTNFGFYKKGSIIYFGIDYGYILNYAGGCTAYIKDELHDVCILVPSRENGASRETGMLQKQQQLGRLYILADSNHISIQNKSITNEVIDGNDLTMVDPSTSKVSTINSGAISRGAGNRKIVSNTTNNKWLGETYAAQMSANSIVISLSVGDIDLEAIRPNKKFVFIFEDTAICDKYKGVYVISNSYIKFINDGADFSTEVALEFKRVADDPTVTESYLS